VGREERRKKTFVRLWVHYLLEARVFEKVEVWFEVKCWVEIERWRKEKARLNEIRVVVLEMK
jgi:hypothetical protein